MTSTNFSDPNVLTAMILSDGVVKGLAVASEALGHVIYGDENPATSIIATLSILTMIKAQLITNVAKETGQPLANILDIDDKVETAVYLSCLLSKSLTLDEITLLINNAEKLKGLMPSFEAAQRHSAQHSNTIATAVSDLNSYLSKKKATEAVSP